MFLLFLLVFQKVSSFCRENESFKNKKQKETKKHWTSLTLKKANIGPVFNFTAYMCMCMCVYIYICAVELLGCPLLTLFRVTLVSNGCLSSFACLQNISSFCREDEIVLKLLDFETYSCGQYSGVQFGLIFGLKIRYESTIGPLTITLLVPHKKGTVTVIIA